MVSRAALLVAALLPGLGQAGELRLRLSAPPSIESDGHTVVPLRLEATPNEDARGLGEVTVDADAGVVGKSRPLADGAFEIDYLPPRVAAPSEVHVAAKIGGVIRSAPVTILVRPVATPIAERASDGPYDLRGPAYVVLGGEGAVTITLKHTARPPQVAVNVGRLGALEAAPDGRWRVAYTPPSEKFPQIAILAAFDDNGTVDWLTLPLHGLGKVRTRTKPSSQLELTIGDQRFGPFRADATGQALSIVAAPPGVKTGVTHAVDPLGNSKETPFDLASPPIGRLLPVCSGDSVHLLLVDGAGARAEPDLPIRLGAASGTFDLTVRIAVGHWAAVYHPAVADQRIEVRAALEGEPSSAGHCSMSPIGDSPTALTLTASSAAFVAGSGPLAIRATLQYPGTHPPRVVEIELSADTGTLVDRQEQATGATVRWQLPDRLPGPRAILRAHVVKPALAAELVVPLAAGRVERLIVLDAPGSRIADGASRGELTVRAEDAFGNPAPAAGVVGSAQGHVAARAPVEGRSVTLDYIAPFSRRGGQDRVTLRDPATGASTSLAIRLLAAPRAFALAARIGYLNNFGKLGGALVLADLLYRLPWLRRNLSVGVEAGYYHAEHDQGGADPIVLTVDAFPVLARVSYQIPLGIAAIYLGVGGGVLVPVSSTRSSTIGNQIATSALGLFAAHLGADLDVRFGRLVVEVGYLYAPSGDPALAGNFGGIAATGGYRVDL